jgi:hypothetical protein
MNNYNQRAGDLWDPPTQTVKFARNSTSNTRLQGIKKNCPSFVSPCKEAAHHLLHADIFLMLADRCCRAFTAVEILNRILILFIVGKGNPVW